MIKELTLCSSNMHIIYWKASSILGKFSNYIPYPIRFPHRNTENDVPFFHLQTSVQPFFGFLYHRVWSQCLHSDQIRRNSTKAVTQKHYTQTHTSYGNTIFTKFFKWNYRLQFLFHILSCFKVKCNKVFVYNYHYYDDNLYGAFNNNKSQYTITINNCS